MPKFPTKYELYRLIQRELPPYAYPDSGQPSTFWSTADSNAAAGVFGTMYSNLERIYDNIFPQTANEQINDHEIRAFGYTLDPSLSLEDRIARVLTKLRARPTLAEVDIKALVLSIIGDDKVVQLIPWANLFAGDWPYAWLLGVSLLGVNTYLGGSISLIHGSGCCDVTAESLGISEEAFQDIRTAAFTMEVRIYGYTPTADELALLTFELARQGRGVSRHVITSGLDDEAWAGDAYVEPLEDE